MEFTMLPYPFQASESIRRRLKQVWQSRTVSYLSLDPAS
jgi:hypothetical protein